jgi:superoxide reductase
MAEKLQVFKCDICGNIVEVLHGGKGQLVCCNESMKELVANTVDASLEKHVPIIEKTENGITVKVGSAPHPMEEKHYIEWIEVIIDSRVYRQFLVPGGSPEAFFPVKGESITAREYCNVHGLWESK